MPTELCNQIAAGEVVERPASVLKELVENSLDAGATQIDVQLDNGGQSLIRVQDNGHGIPEDQLELAITRHATSKITSPEDLENITSYGFRGEALPSIASVSHFRIASIPANRQESGIGHFLEVDHGGERRSGVVSLPGGTLIEVRDLFANLPVRLKFLKSPSAELKRAQTWLERLALANLGTGFCLRAGERQIFKYMPGQTLASRLAQIWPREIVDEMTEVDSSLHEITIKGLAAPPHLQQTKADRILFFVNGRSVNDKRLVGAVREAYKGRITTRDYPQLLLFIEINPSDIDVNVHPAKTEVRFRNEAALFSAVFGALGSAFEKRAFFPNSSEASPPGFWGKIDQPGLLGSKDRAFSHHAAPSAAISAPPQMEYSAHVAEETAVYEFDTLSNTHSGSTQQVYPQRAAPDMEYLGQIADTYLVLRDAKNCLVLIDQHAAHERVLFHKLKTGNLNGESQTLIIPLEIPVSNQSLSRLTVLEPLLARFGYSFTINAGTMLVTSIPPLLERAEARDFLQESLSGIRDDPDSMFIRMACKSAIKAGQKLCRDEAIGLLRQWEGTPEAEFCPHGRPCVLRFDGPGLEKMFKRR